MANVTLPDDPERGDHQGLQRHQDRRHGRRSHQRVQEPAVPDREAGGEQDEVSTASRSCGTAPRRSARRSCCGRTSWTRPSRSTTPSARATWSTSSSAPASSSSPPRTEVNQSLVELGEPDVPPGACAGAAQEGLLTAGSALTAHGPPAASSSHQRVVQRAEDRRRGGDEHVRPGRRAVESGHPQTRPRWRPDRRRRGPRG